MHRLTDAENSAVAMWLMFCANPNPIEITFRDIEVDANRVRNFENLGRVLTIMTLSLQGAGHWEAKYTFEGNPVHNIIDTKFEFRDGLIIKQTDTFSLWNWASTIFIISSHPSV